MRDRLLLHSRPRLFRPRRARHRLADRGGARGRARHFPHLRAGRRARGLRPARARVARAHSSAHGRFFPLQFQVERKGQIFARRFSPAVSRRGAARTLRAHRLDRFRHAFRAGRAGAARRDRSRRKAPRRRVRHDLSHGLSRRLAGAAFSGGAAGAGARSRNTLFQRGVDGDRPRALARTRRSPNASSTRSSPIPSAFRSWSRTR